MTRRILHSIYVLALCATVAAAFALVLALVPWKSALPERLKEALEARGLQNVQLAVTDIGPNFITLTDISIGNTRPFHLKNITIKASLAQLASGRLGEVAVSGLDIEGKEQGGKWTVTGLEGLASEQSSSSGFTMPRDIGVLLPFEQVKLDASQLRLSSAAWQLTVPLNVAWEKKPRPRLDYRATGLNFKSTPLEINTGETTLSLAPDEGGEQWKGFWHMKAIEVKGLDPLPPPLASSGEWSIKGNDITATGSLTSDDGAYALAFKLEYPLAAPEKSRLILSSATLPWNGGKLTVQNVVVPLAVKRDISFPVMVENVSVEALMQSLTGKQASGTGAVSGTLPVTLRHDGTLLIHKGTLRTDAPGKITLSPEAIPGDNEKITLVREILKDLNYSLLAIAIETTPDNQSSVTMSLEGHNPSVYDGRPVKLNVQLTGDVLNLIQQSIMPLLDPRLLLRQDNHEKN